jgi:signal transduction histidine kinase
MADLIGGKLSITSNPNVGTRVLMSFPSQAALAAPLAAQQRKYA